MSRQIQTNNRTTLSEEQTTAKSGGKLLFTDYLGKKAALLIRDDKLTAASFFSEEKSRIGAIYICKVKNAVKNLNAYFVEIGGEEREICFLSAKEAAHPFLLNRKYDGRILEGDEFPVQITRDASKNKQASVTTLLSLSNPYFVFSIGKPGVGFSAKLSAEQKAAVKTQLAENQWELPRMSLPVGLVVRTRAAELQPWNTDDFLSNLQNLQQRWESLFQNAVHRTCFSCLAEPPALWETVFEQLVYPYEYEEILTDDNALYDRMLTCRQSGSDVIPADKKIGLYAETERAMLSLSKLYGLESKLVEALSRKVWLRSGGYLVIEPTEALTVIDVNSGKYESKKESEDTYFSINREAAQEIARQLRLRNLSGMIVVDFINMRSRERQNELLAYLKELVKKDKQKTVVVDITPLGLVEITRKKSSKTLAEQLA